MELYQAYHRCFTDRFVEEWPDVRVSDSLVGRDIFSGGL